MVKHSHSSLGTFQTCPHKYYRERVLRDIQTTQGEAAVWGDTVHKGIEDWLAASDAAPVPAFLNEYADLLLKVRELSGMRFIENKLAVRRDWSACDYAAPDAYFRGKIDLTLIRVDGTAIIIDWKTGKSRYGTKDQDAQYAALLFSTWPLLHVVKTRWVYLAEGKITSNEFKFTDRDRCRALVDSPARQVERAAETNAWPQNPSGLCKKFCDVHDCPYNGAYQPA